MSDTRLPDSPAPAASERRAVSPLLGLGALFATVALTACGGGGGGGDAPAPAPTPAPAPPPCTASPPPPAPAPGAQPPQVTLTMSNGAGVSGALVITLNPTAAPVTVANFLQYVNSGFYNCTLVHRHVPGFIVQLGGFAAPITPNTTPLPTLKTGLQPPIVLEDGAGLSNQRLTVAMARTGVLNSATSQFFINLVDNPGLDRTATQRGYAVFGTITGGDAVVTAMRAAPCSLWPSFFPGDSPDACLPSPNITILSAVQTR
jgi:peptidyl-prolyl cis-trans isomerase A (cyclophilin A)